MMSDIIISTLASDEVELVLQISRYLFQVENFGIELSTAWSVLQNPRHLNGPCPVEVVEALAEDQFLQTALLDFRIAVYDLVMIRHCRTLIGTLWDHVEIVEVANNSLRHQCACRHVSGLSFCEESFRCLHIDHNKCETRTLLMVSSIELLLHVSNEVVLVHLYLVAWARVLKDYYLFRRLLITFQVRVYSLLQ